MLPLFGQTTHELTKRDPFNKNRMRALPRGASDELDALVEGWTGRRTKREVMALLGAVGVPCGAVLDSGEAMANMIVDVEHPVRGRMPIPGSPIRSRRRRPK